MKNKPANAVICLEEGRFLTPTEIKAQADFFKLTKPEQTEVSDAIECALTGHPIEFRSQAAKRFYRKYLLKGVK